MKTLVRLFVLLVISGVLTASALFTWTVMWTKQPIEIPGGKVEFTIAPGSGMRTIANQISAAGVPVQPLLLNLLARYQGRAGRLKAGTYLAESGITPLALLDKLERGDVVLLEVTIPEGLSFAQMRATLAANTDLAHVTNTLSGSELLRAIGADETQPEGLFFPDTYHYARGTSDQDIFRLAYQAQQKHLQAAWQNRAANLPLATPYEALILASIIEKETGKAEDRPNVAAVFINRLRIGMPLQTDPTVIYGLGKKFDGNLRKNDLQSDTPYNTYMRTGLPPTPIALPGRAALTAALNPADSDALYFVARGDGSTVFSSNLNDHNRAVNLYQKPQLQKPQSQKPQVQKQSANTSARMTRSHPS